VSAQILSLKLPASPTLELSEQLPIGRLIEITRTRGGAQMTTAVACLRMAQAQGQPAAWVQPEAGTLFPPDLAQSGIDLDALLIVNVPGRAGAYGLPKAAELLLRSGGFGMVVLDLCGTAVQRDAVWQGRLLGLAREHDCWLLLLSDGAARPGSLGPLVSLCLQPQRKRERQGRFAVEQHVLKDKSGLLCPLAAQHRRGPWGLP
jgi:recombination protein RecA